MLCSGKVLFARHLNKSTHTWIWMCSDRYCIAIGSKQITFSKKDFSSSFSDSADTKQALLVWQPESSVCFISDVRISLSVIVSFSSRSVFTFFELGRTVSSSMSHIVIVHLSSFGMSNFLLFISFFDIIGNRSTSYAFCLCFRIRISFWVCLCVMWWIRSLNCPHLYSQYPYLNASIFLLDVRQCWYETKFLFLLHFHSTELLQENIAVFKKT